jgi:L-fuculose-phosphate aldolase
VTSSQLRKEIIRYSHRLDAKGFVANHDGNVSARLAGEDRFLATPTARGKFDLSEADLIVVDAAGKTRAGGAKIFGEWSLHAEIYKGRPDVAAVIHAHPPEASAFGLAGSPLPVDFWPEGVVSLGRLVPCVSRNLGDAARVGSACLVPGNGVFAWGATIEQAYLRLELVEHLTRIFTLARAAGTLRHLPPDATALLMDKRKNAGLLSPEETLNGV